MCCLIASHKHFVFFPSHWCCYLALVLVLHIGVSSSCSYCYFPHWGYYFMFVLYISVGVWHGVSSSCSYCYFPHWGYHFMFVLLLHNATTLWWCCITRWHFCFMLLLLFFRIVVVSHCSCYYFMLLLFHTSSSLWSIPCYYCFVLCYYHCCFTPQVAYGQYLVIIVSRWCYSCFLS
jgi:hypothetical protein